MNNRELYQSILDYLRKRKGAYTKLIDIGNAVGLDHLQKVQHRLDQLERWGAMYRNKNGGWVIVVEKAEHITTTPLDKYTTKLPLARYKELVAIEEDYYKLLKLLSAVNTKIGKR